MFKYEAADYLLQRCQLITLKSKNLEIVKNLKKCLTFEQKHHEIWLKTTSLSKIDF